MLAGVLQDIFQRLGGAVADPAPDRNGGGACIVSIDGAIEHVIDEVSGRLRAVPGYARVLRKPVLTTLRHIDEIVESIPDALLCCRSTFSEDPRINAFFVSPRHIQEVFSGSREVRELFDANPLAAECWALMCVRQQERTQLGMALIGDEVHRDVMQTAVSFTDHQLVSPGTDEGTARCALKCCIFNGLLSHIRRRANDAKSHLQGIDNRISLARRRLRALDEGPGRDDARYALRAEIAELEGQRAGLDLQLPTLNDHLRFVAQSLSRPADFLSSGTRSLRLSRMAIKLTPDSKEAGYELQLPEIRIASHFPRIGALVRFPRDELLPQPDFVKEADLFLSL